MALGAPSTLHTKHGDTPPTSLLLNSSWFGLFLRLVAIRLGLFCLQFRIGLVSFAYGSSRPEIGFGLVAYGYPTASTKDGP